LEFVQTVEVYNIEYSWKFALRMIISTLEGIAKNAMCIKINSALARVNKITSLFSPSKKIEALLGPIRHSSLEAILS
jgi:hypothetical protein